MKIKRCLILLIYASMPSWAGQSIVLSTTTTGTMADASMNATTDARVEFQIHVASPTAVGVQQVFNLLGTGVRFVFNTTQPNIQPIRTGDAYPGGVPCVLSLSYSGNYLIRVQRDHSGGSTGNFSCEVWNVDGTGYTAQTLTLTTIGTGDGSGSFLGGGGSADLGFLRVCSTLVPLNTKPPTSAGSCDISEWKFDGNLNDSSGNGHNITYSGISYVNTPGQTAYAKLKTYNAPVWSDWMSLKAGATNQFDGSASYTMIDVSSQVTNFWQQMSGGTTLLWNNRASSAPIVSGAVFGPYTVRLTVTDSSGNVSTADLDVGAVAMDTNSVVIPAVSSITTIFGNQIAFGRNPWGYYDERHIRLITTQPAYLSLVQDLTWLTNGTGTISYPFGQTGRQPYNISSGTTITANISSSTLQIPIANAALMNFTSTPTWVFVGGANYGIPGELVRISSVSALTGAATMYVAYDGRGLGGHNTFVGGAAVVSTASAWSSGATVGQMLIQGSGTKFITDANRPICPAGAPGPVGPVIYTSGTVTLLASSTTITGTGVTFATTMGGGFIRVSATHGGGTPFVWWDQIVYQDSTHLQSYRTIPADIDGTGFSYAITAEIHLSLEITDPIDAHAIPLIQTGVGCESETSAFGLGYYDNPTFDTQAYSGMHYSYKRTLFSVATTNFAPYYYSPGLAFRNLYYRSGYGPALAQANQWDEYYLTDPQIAERYGAASNVLIGGGPTIAAAVDITLNTSSRMTWKNFRKAATEGSIGTGTYSGCNSDDTRDTGYWSAWLALADLFDTASSTTWHSNMGDLLVRDNRCIRNASDGYTGAAENSFAHAALFNVENQNPPLNLTNGSAAVTGNSFTTGMCPGVATGTIRVTTGQSSATIVTGGPPYAGIRLFIADTSSSPVYTTGFEFAAYTSSVILAGIWPGNTGTFDFMIEDNRQGGYVNAISTTNVDTLGNNMMLTKPWSCMRNSATSITLNRSWDGPSTSSLAPGTSYYIHGYVVDGFFQQPFMVGILANKINWGAQSSSAPIAAGYQAMQPKIGNWMANYGYDPNTKGTWYTRVFGMCEPFVTQTSSPPVFTSIHGYGPTTGYQGCGASGNAQNGEERVSNSEAGSAMINFYKASPTQANKDIVDQYYGAVYGYCPYTTGGAYCDSGYVNFLLQDASLSGPKWTGFFFGMGGFFGSSWPAERLGSTTAINRNLQVGFKLSSVPNATQVRVNLTKPSGELVQSTCSSSPCAITGDARQGSHLVKLEYLSSGNAVLASGEQQIQAVN